MRLSTLEIGVAQLRSITGIVPNALYLVWTNKSPNWYDFHASGKAARYSVIIASVLTRHY